MKPETPREAADLARLLQFPAERVLPGRRHWQLKEYVMQEIGQSAESDRSAQLTPEVGAPPEDRAARGEANNSPSRRPRRRLAYFAAPVAAAGAFAIVAVNGGTGSQHGTTAHGGSTATAPASAGNPTMQLLGRIADVAQSKPLPTVRDDQFVYVESKVSSEQDTLFSSGYHSTLSPLHVRQIWHSVNGKEPGLLRDGATDAALGPIPTPNVNAPDYRYLESLPTDPAKLFAKIYRETKGEGQAGGPDAEAFVTIGDLLREQIAPPAVTAALYKAAAMIPGVHVIDDVVDVTGKHEVAVALNNPIATNEWLFDKSSLEYVGEQTISLKAGPLGPVGTIVGTQIMVERAIVDRAGEVPGSSDH